MTKTLRSSDKKYGVLSCNYQSWVLNNSTLAEYVLRKGLSIDGQYKKLISNENAVSEFRRIRRMVKDEHLQTAIDNIPIDPSYRLLNDTVARELQLSKIQENEILNLYVNSFSGLTDSDIGTMDLTEKRQVIDRLMKLYREGKLNQIEGFGDKMDELFFNQPSVNGMTVKEYVDDRMKANTNSIIEYMIKFMHAGIQKRLIEPVFTSALMEADVTSDGMLDFKIPKSSDEDVLEKLNIVLLSKFRKKLQKFDLSDSALFSQIKHPIHFSYIYKLLQFTAGVRNYIRSQKIPFVSTNKSISSLLDLSFPNCSNIPIKPPYAVPEEIKNLVKTVPGFKTINAGIFWKYHLMFIAMNGLNEITDKSEDDVKALVVKVGNIYISKIPRIISQQDLENARIRGYLRSGNVIIYSIPNCPACIEAKTMIVEWINKTMARKTASKYFVERTPDEIPTTLRLKLADSDGSVSVPVIVVGGEYLGGVKELKNVLNSVPIRAKVRSSGFMPTNGEMVDYEFDNEDGQLIEYDDNGGFDGALAVISAVVASATAPITMMTKMGNNAYSKQKDYKSREREIIINFKRNVAGTITGGVGSALSNTISIESRMGNEIEQCGMALANAKLHDDFSISKATNQFIEDAKKSLEGHFTRKQLELMAKNTANALLRDMDIPEYAYVKLKDLGWLDDNYDPSVFVYSPPLMKGGGIGITLSPEYSRYIDGVAKPVVCSMLKTMEIHVDKYIDCFNEATFQTACPRLDREFTNAVNDAFKLMEPQIESHTAAAGRDLAQAQIDTVIDQGLGFVSSSVMYLITTLVWFIIMKMFRQKITNGPRRREIEN